MKTQLRIGVLVCTGALLVFLLHAFGDGQATAKNNSVPTTKFTYTNGQFCALIPGTTGGATAIFPVPDGFTVAACQQAASSAFQAQSALVLAGCASPSGIKWSGVGGTGAPSLSCGWH